MSQAEQENWELCISFAILLPNLHNAQSANKQHYRNTFTSTLKTWGSEIQQFYFNELCFLNLFYFFPVFIQY